MARIGLAAALVIVAVVLAAAASQLVSFLRSPSSQPPQLSSRAALGASDATGILLVDVGEQIQAAPTGEPMAMAISGLWDLEMANPDDLGYAWVDPETHELVLSAATERGRALLEETAANLGFPYRIRDVAYSYAELERIKHDATRLVEEGLPDADLIFETSPDHRDNRAMITISEMSRPLLEALARRFPPDAVAVRVDPTGSVRDRRPDP